MFNLYVFDYQLQYKEAEGSSHRDGSYAETPGTPKVSVLIFSLLIMELHVLVCHSKNEFIANICLHLLNLKFWFDLVYETIDSDPTALGNRIGHLFLTP